MQDEILVKTIAVHCFLVHGDDASRKQIHDVTRSFHINNNRDSLSKRNREWVHSVEAYFEKVGKISLNFNVQRQRVDRKY